MIKNKNKVKGRAVFELIVAISLIIIMSSVIMGIIYYIIDVRNYEDNVAYAYAKSAAQYIDGDAAEEYLNGRQPDDYYWEIQNLLNVYAKESNLYCYYVIVPEEDRITYIWDTEFSNGESFLDWDEYAATEKEFLQSVYFGDTSKCSQIISDDVYGIVAVSVSPIYNSKGQTVALAAVDMSISFIVYGMIKVIWIIALGISTVIFVGMLLFFFFINKEVFEPIGVLIEATRSMTHKLSTGEDFNIDIKTNNEIEELADAFVKMNVDIRDYIAKYSAINAEKGRIDTELNLARTIQTHVIPSDFPAFPERTEFDLYASMNAAREVGGDFYDFFMIDDDHLGLTIADVSGKGIPAAMFMMISKTMIKNCAQRETSPATILSSVNNSLAKNNEADMFVTVWLGILQISTGKMLCSNGGHEYPIIKRAGGNYEILKDKHGFVLGGFENSKYVDYELQFNKDDMLVVYTDGIPEAINDKKEFFGMERFVEVLNLYKEEDVKNIVTKINDEISDYTAGEEQFDDITMLAFRYSGK